MAYASSASCTCRAEASASEYTATDSIPRSAQARMTRTAISPRLATRTRRSCGSVMAPPRPSATPVELDDRVSGVDDVLVIHDEGADAACGLRTQLVELLHDLHDPDDRAGLLLVALLDKRRRARVRPAV